MTLHRLPAPVKTPPAPRYRIAQAVLTPDNKVKLVVGHVMRPEGLMAFVVDAATPAGRRKSTMVPYDSLRAAPCGAPRLVHPRSNSRNPFAPCEDPSADKPVTRAEPRPIHGHAAAFVIVDELVNTTPRKSQSFADDAPLPAFLRGVWARDAQGRKLTPYSPRLAALSLLAFRVWPARAARHFDLARTIEAARTGALRCGPSDQSLLARLASTDNGR
jgi:hypothetical protein